jgi:hypothetical protein
MNKISKDGNRITTVEFEVRPIDQYGDAIDVYHYESLVEADKASQQIMGCQQGSGDSDREAH